MPDVSIDHLNLHLSGFVEEDGRRLARLIAEGLSGVSLPGGGKEVPSVQVNVTAPQGSSMKRISEQVLADLVGQLKRSM